MTRVRNLFEKKVLSVFIHFQFWICALGCASLQRRPGPNVIELLKHKMELSTTKSCLQEYGYQPKYHFSSTFCDWCPDNFCLAETFWSNVFYWSSSMKLDPGSVTWIPVLRLSKLNNRPHPLPVTFGRPPRDLSMLRHVRLCHRSCSVSWLPLCAGPAGFSRILRDPHERPSKGAWNQTYPNRWQRPTDREKKS